MANAALTALRISRSLSAKGMGLSGWAMIMVKNGDPALRRAKTAEAFKFYRDHQDSEFGFSEMWKKITDNV